MTRKPRKCGRCLGIQPIDHLGYFVAYGVVVSTRGCLEPNVWMRTSCFNTAPPWTNDDFDDFGNKISKISLRTYPSWCCRTMGVCWSEEKCKNLKSEVFGCWC